MKKLLALILCSLSFSIFASDIDAEYKRVGAVLIAKPFDLKKFEAAIKATTHLKDDIDYAPMNSKTIIHVAVNKDYDDAVKLLVEKFKSDIRQIVKTGPGGPVLTSYCLYMGSTKSYKYLYSIQTKDENGSRKDMDEKLFIAGVKADAVNEAWLADLRRETANHEKIMKKVHSFSLRDLFDIIKPVIGSTAGNF